MAKIMDIFPYICISLLLIGLAVFTGYLVYLSYVKIKYLIDHKETDGKVLSVENCVKNENNKNRPNCIVNASFIDNNQSYKASGYRNYKSGDQVVDVVYNVHDPNDASIGSIGTDCFMGFLCPFCALIFLCILIYAIYSLFDDSNED